MGKRQDSIEIGGREFLLDISKVTIGEWQNMLTLFNSGRPQEAGECLVKMVLKVMGPEAGDLPVTYLSVLIPRVMEKVGEALSPGDVETELDEILGIRKNNES